MITETFSRIKANIEAYGWHAMSVFPTEQEPIVPFTYTIGLTEKGLPELIIFGLPFKTAHGLLRCAVDDLTKRKHVEDGLVSDEIAAGLPCTYRELPRDLASEEHTSWADSYYADRDMRVFQVVWPDRAGRFPWHPDCDEANAADQSEIIDWRERGQQ